MNQTDPTASPQSMARALVGGLALLLALAGQLALAAAPMWLWPGLALSGAGLLLFGWAVLRPPPGWLVGLMGRLRLTYRALLVSLATVLSVLAALFSVNYAELGRTNYTPVLVLLALAGMAYLGAFMLAWRPPALAALRAKASAHRNELLALGLIILAAAGFRFYQLGSIPRVINGDEGVLGQAAILSRALPLANPFALFENFGGLYMQGIGLAINLFGRTAFALRLLPALGGVLAVAVIYLLGRQLAGPRVGLMAAAMLALSHAHIHFSRSVAVGYIQGTWLGPLIVYFFYSGLQRRSPARLAAGGLLLGLFFSVYLGAQILAAFLFVFLLVAWVLCRPLVRGLTGSVAAFWYGTLLMALPQAVYSFSHPDEFFSRLNADGTFQSGWLVEEMARTGHAAPVILLDRVAHAFLSLDYYPALEFYGSTLPLLGFLTAALFLLGAVYALLRLRQPAYLLLTGYFWSTVVAVGMFAVPIEADSYRMLIAVPAAVLLAAVGWESLFALFTARANAHRYLWVGLSSLLIAAIAVVNLTAYFFVFAGTCRHGGDVQTRFASHLGSYLATVDRNAAAYLLNTDTLRYGTHSSVDFLSGDHPVMNVPGPASELAPVSPGVVIAAPTRADELLDFAHLHPGGTFDNIFDCQQLALLAYRLP